MTFTRNHKVMVAGGAAICLLIAILVASRVRAGGPPHTKDGREVVPAAVAIAKRTPIGNPFLVAGEFIPYQDIELHASLGTFARSTWTSATGGRVWRFLGPGAGGSVQGAGAGVRQQRKRCNACRTK